MDKAELVGCIEFSLRDYREDEFNESTSCSFDLYNRKEGELLSIEKYWSFCKLFAAAMGFSETTISEYFGTM